MGALPDAPAVVAALDHGVDLLVAPVADIAHEQPAGAIRLPRQAPRVPEPVGVDLGPTRAVDEGVVGRDRVRRAGVDVQAQHLAVQPGGVLRIALRSVALVSIATTTAIAGPQVQIPVGAEAEGAAAVVRLWLSELEHDPLGIGVRPIRVAGYPELAQSIRVIDDAGSRRRGGSRVVDEEPTVRRVVGVERQAEQTALVVFGVEPDEGVGQVEEGHRLALAVAEDMDPPRLLDDE